MKPLVYVAAPYSTGDQVANARDAILWGERLWDTGLIVPLIPHLNIAWHLASPHPLEYWYTYDLELLCRCDALIRIDGDSSGADAEVRAAKDLGLPVFLSGPNCISELSRWAISHAQ